MPAAWTSASALRTCVAEPERRRSGHQSSSAARASQAPVGLDRRVPVRCGDEPCAGSNRPVAPAPNFLSGLMVADPHRAGEPARAQTMSDRMSPKMPSVAITAGSRSNLTSS